MVCCTADHRPIKSRFMNRPAVGNNPYIPTPLEHIANCVTHGLLIVPSLFAILILLRLADSPLQFVNAVVYGLALVALFTLSTSFHLLAWTGKLRSLLHFFHVCDRAVIYFFIAASYMPWLTLRDSGALGQWVHGVTWVLALMGTVFSCMFLDRCKRLETSLYLIMGICPSLSVFSMPCTDGLKELSIGGAVYIAGVFFFKSDGRIPFAHATWHLFVVVGAAFHYYAVVTYLMGARHDGIAAGHSGM
ncbi:monocyte to macrophage differentiation factor-like [Branchiostoma lanceolatum]|uniref:monocyte to macrophage differentiation factor-like n=1 Tax=Branchiostoma lanceolatum TaxID=7740 RepID=UPI0034570FA0